jgi:hypothetical protein
MEHTTYYTVIIGKRACLVTYAAFPAYETKLFSGAFASLDEAHEQFKKSVQGHFAYLTPGAFTRLSLRYEQNLMRVAAWHQGQPVHTERKDTPMALTLAQFFNTLPANGLELAEDYLEQDLAILQENDLPVNDTVAGLLMAHSRRTGQDDESMSEEELL